MVRRGQFSIGAALALLAIFALSSCGTSGSKIGVKEATAKSNADGVQMVDINVHSFYFDPNRINVQSGKPVELALHFRPWFVPHNMTCEHPEAGITIDKSIGIISFSRTKHVRFTPTKAGEYRFWCAVDKHGMKGMTGTLVVR